MNPKKPKEIPSKIWKHFFEVDKVKSVVSIYSCSPVFKINYNDTDYVLKQTRSPIQDGQSIIKWAQSLNSYISIVTASNFGVKNPIEYEEDVWVIYPFISGVKYTATHLQIKQAGELLGKIHASNFYNHKLPKFSFPDEVNYDSFLEDYENIKISLKKNQLKLSDQLDKQLLKSFHQFESLVKKLSLLANNKSVQWVNCTWDYKANNLIYHRNKQPTLIDPDNGGHIPRIFDLALCVLLFHNECSSAPSQLFSKQQWQIFFNAYKKQITLSDIEISLWFDALEFMFLDEAIWLLGNDDDGWKNKHQGQFLFRLLNEFLNLKDITFDY
ncbi:MAG: hypothetical protein COB02_06650 [Candidatus Cloacimonadota bacterium]|nr:MAG: hypothetical protein COB02_06650 [Candidatus Cloacimonadota bacterium]